MATKKKPAGVPKTVGAPKTAKQETKNPEISRVELRKTAPDSEFSIDFIDRMLYHMGGRSFERYGPIEKRYPIRDQALQHITERFTKYLYTRNRKFLVDAANFSMIEFLRPSLEDAYYQPTDSDASPGRIMDGGEQTAGRNTGQKPQVSGKPSAALIILETATPESEYSQKYLQGMIDRMSVSFHKYGAVKDGYPYAVNAPESLLLRINKYVDSRNTEFLIDVANFCMIEFMLPSLVSTHYNPIEDMGEAGRAAVRTFFNTEA